MPGPLDPQAISDSDSIDVTHLPGRVLGLPSVFGRRHLTDLPAAVHLVAQTPVLHVVGLSVAVLAPQLAPLRAPVDIAVLHQRRRVLRGSGAQIQSHQRQRAHLLAPRHVFVRAELIRVDGIPCLVEHARAILLRADAVEPVVAGNKVPAGITNDGNAELANFIHHVLAKTVGVRKLRAGIVDAFVNRATEMLKEGAEKIAVQRSDRSPGVHEDARGLVCGRRTLRRQKATKQSAGGQCQPCAGSLLQETASRGHGVPPSCQKAIDISVSEIRVGTIGSA